MNSLPGPSNGVYISVPYQHAGATIMTGQYGTPSPGMAPPMTMAGEDMFQAYPTSQAESTAMAYDRSNTGNMTASANDPDTCLNNNDDDGGSGGKRRRVQRACDTCRKKKIRCDGLQPEKGACSNCANYGLECTFVDAARKRAPPRSYVDALEARMSKIEELLEKLAPGVDFSDRLGKPVRRPDEKGETAETDKLPTKRDSRPSSIHSPLESQHVEGACVARNFGDFMASQHTKGRSGSNETNEASTDDEDDDIAFIETGLAQTNISHADKQGAIAGEVIPERPVFRLGEMNQNDDFGQSWGDMTDNRVHRFVGKASDIHLIPLLEKIAQINRNNLGIFPKGPRTEFWHYPKGLVDPPPSIEGVAECWPQADLADKLIDAFFSRPNRDSPILNEAQFRHEYYKQPELRQDHEFLGVALGVFMVASHYVDDPRTIGDPKDRRSNGIQWWNMSKKIGWTLCPLKKPIKKIQTMLLSILFQLSTPLSVSNSWGILGVCVRYLQDHGAHRKMTARKLALSPVEEENSKRAFWVAYSWDRELSTMLGRPLMMHDEDIDVELPLEVDDEIIFNAPNNGPVPEQPAGKPALISGFINTLRLDEIIGRTLKTIYALQKTKVRYGFVGLAWDERIVAEIDSALNNWLDTVPDHLRYDPHQENDEYLLQSSLLYSKYYQCQTLVHRPFISSSKTSSSLNFPSLAICTNAARSISHVVDNLKKRDLQNVAGVPLALRASKASAILLLVIWGAKRNGGKVSSSAMTDLRRSMDVLKTMEAQWQVCGKFYDVLDSLITSSELPVPIELSEQTLKRRHQTINTNGHSGDSVISPTPRDPLFVNANEEGMKPSNRKLAGKKSNPSESSLPQVEPAFDSRLGVNTLPLSTYQLAFSSMNHASNEPSPAQSSPLSHHGASGSEANSADKESMRPPPINGFPHSNEPVQMPLDMFTPLGFGMSSGSVQPNSNYDYMHGSGSDAGVTALTSSIFDDVNFGPQGRTPSAPSQQFDQFLFEQPQVSFSSAPPTGSNPVANYAFELLQKQNLWGMDEEYLDFLQQQQQMQEKQEPTRQS